MRQASIPASAGLRRPFASAAAELIPTDTTRPPGHLTGHFWRAAEPGPSLLIKLASPREETAEPPSAGGTATTPPDRNAASILRSVFIADVVPQLAVMAIARPLSEQSLSGTSVAELADLLVAPDQTAALDLIEEFCGRVGSGTSLVETVFEPAARRLGDLWNEDLCSELDVTLGLCRLQSAARLLSVEPARRLPSSLPQPAVLIVPEPGELHHLGAALDTLILRNAGWSPHCEYPRSDDALGDLLASTWFDVLDLSLSGAFRREHRLGDVTRTIARARSVSRNPALVVIVGGRIFCEDSAAALDVGADRATTTSLTVKRTILTTVQATATAVFLHSDEAQLTATAS